MAGHETEVCLLGSGDDGDEDDRRWINYMLDDLLPADADVPAYATRLRAVTKALVRRHASRIERVAQVLLDRGRLRAKEVDRLF
jgi:hypothetical protein